MSGPTVTLANDWIADIVADALAGLDVTLVRAPRHEPPGAVTWPESLWPELVVPADVIVASPIAHVTREMMAAAPRLRAVVSPVIGVESIDTDAATELGIVVGHGATPENFLAMAEATVMFIAELAMQRPFKERLLRENLPRPREMTSRSVRGSTVGIIGMGRIGRGVVERLAGWDMRILYTDPYVPQEEAPAGTERVPLERLLAESDFVSLHVPLNAETTHLIGAAELARMRSDAYLINTARGPVVDEAALVTALEEGRIAGAALDVFEVEPLPASSPLRALIDTDRVILTPHIIGHTRDVMRSLPPAAVENVTRVLAGEPPLYVRNPEVLERWHQRLADLPARSDT